MVPKEADSKLSGVAGVNHPERYLPLVTTTGVNNSLLGSFVHSEIIINLYHSLERK